MVKYLIHRIVGVSEIHFRSEDTVGKVVLNDLLCTSTIEWEVTNRSDKLFLPYKANESAAFASRWSAMET